MKKLITFALGTFLFLPSLGWSINSPSIIWPTQEGYHVTPNTYQLFQFQTHINNCDVILTLYTVVGSIKTPIETKFSYAKSKNNHVDIYFKIPECLMTENLCLGVRNQKGSSFSNEVFRNLTSDLMQIPVNYPIPLVQFKCNSDDWDPIIPRGTIAAYNSPNIDPSGVYNGQVNYYNFQDPTNTTSITSTNNGVGFTPYLLPIPAGQQSQSGTYKYKVLGTSSCQNPIPTPGIMSFLRLNINFLLDNKYLEGRLVDPEIIPCSDRVQCNLPLLTFFPLPGPGQLLVNGLVKDVKYYFIDNNQQRIENERMTSMGTSNYFNSIIQMKKVCFDDLKNIQGVPETCNYIIEYSIEFETPVPFPPYTNVQTCKIEIPVTVHPITSPTLAAANSYYNEVVSTFNNVKNQFINIPGISDDFICDLIYNLYDVIPSGLIIDETFLFDDNNKFFARNNDNIQEIVKELDSQKDDLIYEWYLDDSLVSIEKYPVFQSMGNYSLFVSSNHSIPMKVYSLSLVNKKIDCKLADLVSENDFTNFISCIPSEMKLDNFYTSTRTHFELPKSSSLYTYKNKSEFHNDFELFPNPSNGNVTIKSRQPAAQLASYTYEILTIDGKRIIPEIQNASNGEIKMDLTFLEPGVYGIIISSQFGFIKSLKLKID